MRPYVHYDTHQTQYLTGDKTTARLLFVLTAAQVCSMEHNGLRNAYIQETAMDHNPILFNK